MTDHRDRRPWAPEEDALIRAGGESAFELASRLDRTPQAVRQRRYVLRRPARGLVVVGVDPGLTTGVAVLRVTTDGQALLVGRAELPPGRVREYVVTELDLAPGGCDQAIGCERYATLAGTARRSAQPEAQQVIGVVRDVAAERGVPLLLQSPDDAKRLAGDDLLRRLGWYDAARDHATDGVRHALRVVAVLRASVIDRLLQPGTI